MAVAVAMQPTHARQRLLSNEFPGGEKRDGGLLPVMRNDGEFCPARAKIEDGVSRISLRKEDLLGLQLDDFSSHSRFFQKGDEVKGHASHSILLNGPSRMRSSRERFGRVRGRFRSEVAGVARLPSRVYKIIHPAVFVGADLCLRVTEHAGSVPITPQGPESRLRLDGRQSGSYSMVISPRTPFRWLGWSVTGGGITVNWKSSRWLHSA
jgi:hypothetical protein